MTLRMNGRVVFDPESRDGWFFQPHHNRDDYRLLEHYRHVRPKLMTHVEQVEYADGTTSEFRTYYVELKPVVGGSRTECPPKLARARETQHHTFPRATPDEWFGASLLADAHRKRVVKVTAFEVAA